MQRQAHSLLALATIAFSKSGLDENHCDLVREQSLSPYTAVDYLVSAGKPSTEVADNLAMCLHIDIERRMLALARELDELSGKYIALDEKLAQ